VLYEKRGWASDGDVAAFLGAGYIKANVLDVVLATALKTISNYTNHIADAPLDAALQLARWSKSEAA
jgi:alkylhydroperoxidase family enzyme